MAASNFELELSDFLFIQRNMRNGRGLRFTLTWRLITQDGEVLGMSVPGWMATRTADGTLRVNPPIVRWRPGASGQPVGLITQDLANLVVDTLKGTKYAEKVGPDWDDPLRPLRPEEIDPTLPAVVTNASQTEETDSNEPDGSE